MTIRIQRRQFMMGSTALAAGALGVMPSFAQAAGLRQFFRGGGSSASKEKAAACLSFFVNDLAAAKVLGVERGSPASSLSARRSRPASTRRTRSRSTSSPTWTTCLDRSPGRCR